MTPNTEDTKRPRFKPATDIIETETGFAIYMDLPGVAKEDLVIDLGEDELKISAKTSYPAPADEKLGHVEFGNGEYVRAFTLSQIVDKEKIKAVMKNGVLELTLPKAEKSVPRKIEIRAE